MKVENFLFFRKADGSLQKLTADTLLDVSERE